MANSLGWLGAVVVFLVLAVAAVRSRNPAAIRAGYIAMDLSVRFAVVPLAAASLLSGLVSSLGTPWGLVRHWWVVVKLILVVVATAVLMLQLAPIRELAEAAMAPGPAAVAGQWREVVSLVVHAGGGIIVLLAATVLAVYKPRGMTRYGQRRAVTHGQV
ncbi:DUF2269 domain-containing protein [Micromonospora deserti]|uniref:DUF2269 domain-containing protein n=1 Tax=Micromonospora deserti TaxID=2070366 RepID=UPI0018F63987|nr:DUF2269 domain-containing protein [Micromonospora deserti]